MVKLMINNNVRVCVTGLVLLFFHLLTQKSNQTSSLDNQPIFNLLDTRIVTALQNRPRGGLPPGPF